MRTRIIIVIPRAVFARGICCSTTLKNSPGQIDDKSNAVRKIQQTRLGYKPIRVDVGVVQKEPRQCLCHSRFQIRLRKRSQKYFTWILQPSAPQISEPRITQSTEIASKLFTCIHRRLLGREQHRIELKFPDCFSGEVRRDRSATLFHESNMGLGYPKTQTRGVLQASR